MKFFNKINKKALLSIFGMAFLVFVGSANSAHAGVAGEVANAIGDVSYTVVGKIAFAIGYIIAAFAGILIAIEAWLIGVVLNINASVLQTTFVQTGFSISLAVANLAFVLGIIVIAIATILRSESYGIKKLLWKLVVAAILVNFGLVIMAPIFALGNSFTQYFLNCISPAAGGCNANSSGLSSFNTFATTLTSAFNPQNGIVALNSINSSSSQALAGSGVSGLFAVSGQDLGKLIVPVVSIAFVIINSGLIAIVLGTLLIMLIVRYIYIAILAILMPFAWASWVFPGFESHWKKWWDTFLRWTFFGPIVLFFLYLALLTMSSLGNVQNSTMNFATYTSSSNSVWAAISNYFTNIFSPIIQSSLQEVLLAGLIVGGLMAANSMGIKMAGSTVDFVQKQGKAAGKAARGYAWKQSKKGLRAAADKTGVNKAVQNMRTNQTTALRGIPIVGKAANWAVRRGTSLAGRAIEPSLTNKDLVDESKKKVPEDLEKVKENLKGSMNMEDRLAHLAKLIEKGKLDKNTMVGDQKASEFLDANEGILKERYGYGKNLNDADIVLGSNKAMRAATDEASLDTATKGFVEKLEKGDVAKMNVSEALGESTPLSKALAKGFALYAPHLASAAIPKLKAGKLKNFKNMYEEQITEEEDKSPNLLAIKTSKAEIEALDTKISKIEEDAKSQKRAINDAMLKTPEEKVRETREVDRVANDQMEASKKERTTRQEDLKKAQSSLSEEEKNLVFAMKSLTSAMGHNAMSGAEEHAPAAEAAPAAAPTAH